MGQILLEMDVIWNPVSYMKKQSLYNLIYNGGLKRLWCKKKCWSAFTRVVAVVLAWFSRNLIGSKVGSSETNQLSKLFRLLTSRVYAFGSYNNYLYLVYIKWVLLLFWSRNLSCVFEIKHFTKRTFLNSYWRWLIAAYMALFLVFYSNIWFKSKCLTAYLLIILALCFWVAYAPGSKMLHNLEFLILSGSLQGTDK